jgi:glucose-1-phosphate adenylyltransferase
MDYSEMIAAHAEHDADLTIACTEVPRGEASRFGVMGVDEQWRIQRFQEKPREPDPAPQNPELALVSMGIYVFNTERLVREVIDAAKRESHHDFGKNIIPRMLETGKNVYAFPFRDHHGQSGNYWRDIGTLDSYFDANMDLVSVNPDFHLYDAEWPLRTYQPQLPPASLVFRGDRGQGKVLDSLISNGCIINGGCVTHAILGPRVCVHEGAWIEESVVFENVEIHRSAKVRRAIIDKDVKIPPGEVIGYDLEKDRQRFTVTENGVVVIPKGMVMTELR